MLKISSERIDGILFTTDFVLSKFVFVFTFIFIIYIYYSQNKCTLQGNRKTIIWKQKN